jgi:gliding motility-associated protein GldM
MAGYKETPRQKMIAMMYLVLTALLALNVSKDILNAFLVVNESMESTNEGLISEVSDVYRDFKTQYEQNKEKTGEYYNKAIEVRNKTQEVVRYLEHLKYMLVGVSEYNIPSRIDSIELVTKYYRDSTLSNGTTKPVLMLKDVDTKDKYDNTTTYMIGMNDEGEAYFLKKKLQDYRQYLLNVMNQDQNYQGIGLMIKDGNAYRNADKQAVSWEYYNFYHTILAADITIVNKLINEVKNSELDAVNYLLSSISASDFKFASVSAKVIPKSTYIFKGQDYEAEILVAAFDDKAKPDVYIRQGVSEWKDSYLNGAKKISGAEGIVPLKIPANTEGPQKYAGIIQLRDPVSGEIQNHPFNGEYIVAPPSLTVAPLKMNVFYIGVENPVSISAPGIPASKIKPVITTGQLYKKDNNYAVKISKKVPGNKVTVSATAEVDGKTMNLGSSEFRVKRVPSPTAEIAGKTDGKIDKNTLLAAGAIIPNMKDFNFDLYFTVTSFTFATIVNGDWIPKNVKGNRFTTEINNIIKNSKRKQKFFFEKIQAKGPDGTVRSLNPINLEIK